MPTPSEAPRLGDWMTASEVAESLGLSRQTVNRMIHEGQFESLHVIGERPTYIVRTVEVLGKVRDRLEQVRQPS